MALRRDAKVGLLKRVPLFAECTKQELAAIAAAADELFLREGDELTRQGEAGREFVILVEGEAEVRRKGRRQATLGAGDFFGEIALLMNRPRTATVVARTPVRVLIVTDRSFDRLLAESPSVQSKVLRALAARVQADI